MPIPYASSCTREITPGSGGRHVGANNLTKCEDAIAAFEQATGRSLPRPAPSPPPLYGTAVAPPPIPLTGFTVEVRRPATWAQRWWAGPSSTGGPTMAGSGAPSTSSACLLVRGGLHTTATSRAQSCRLSRLGAARHGGHVTRRRPLRIRWVLHSPGGRCDPGPSAPGPPTLSLSLVGSSSQLSALGPGARQKFAENVLLMPASVAFPWSQRTAAQHYSLRCIFVTRITNRDNIRFVSHRFCHCARPSLRCSGTRRYVICLTPPFIRSSFVLSRYGCCCRGFAESSRSSDTVRLSQATLRVAFRDMSNSLAFPKFPGLHVPAGPPNPWIRAPA